jgi:hypothetical protein
MEKIKASEVLKGFAYWAIDKDGHARIHTRMPSIAGDCWRIEDFNPKLDNVYTVDVLTVPITNWQNSLREIDFSEDFAEERLSLVNYISSYLAKELSLRDYNRIKGFFEEMEKPKFFDCSPPDYANIFKSGRITAGGITTENQQDQIENKSIFQEGDTVHVLSYSNQGELGVSTQGVVGAIKSNSFIAVEIVNGIEEIHEEKNISFTPFSIHEAGFSQVRPTKKGSWGWFWDNDDDADDGYRYSMFECVDGKRFMNTNGMCYDNFSLKNPVQHC